MKLTFALFTFLSLMPGPWAYRYNWHLKGGINQSYGSIKGLASKHYAHGTGFNTHFGRKWKYFELNISSYVSWGEMEELTLQARGERITGEGNWRNVAFGPLLKYQFRGLQPLKNWFIYIGLGPTWSMQTVEFDDHFTSTGNLFNKNQKLAFESYGGTFSLGIEEDLPYKEMHQVYIELTYSYMSTSKVSVVDKSDFTETNILSEEELHQDFSGHFLMLAIGITIF